MRHRLHIGARRFEIGARDAGSSAPGTTVVPAAGARLLRLAARESSSVRVLRRLARGRSTGGTTQQVVDDVAAQLLAGRLVLRELPEAHVAMAPREPEAPEEDAADEATDREWIEFLVIDDETEDPVSDVELKVILPGESEARSFKTDGSGKVRVDDLNGGTCEIEKMLDAGDLSVVKMEIG